MAPKNTLTPGNPIFFDLESTTDFLDLSQTQIKICRFHYLNNADYDDDDDGDLVDEDNDSWQAPAVTLVEQQKIYGIAQSTLNSLWGTCQRYAIRLGHPISILTYMECME